MGLFFFVSGSLFLVKGGRLVGLTCFQGLRLENSWRATLWVFLLLSLSFNSSWQDE